MMMLFQPFVVWVHIPDPYCAGRHSAYAQVERIGDVVR